MDGTIKNILSRVLSEELGKQVLWEQKDLQSGIKTDNRAETRLKIIEYMDKNDIPFIQEYYINARI